MSPRAQSRGFLKGLDCARPDIIIYYCFEIDSIKYGKNTSKNF